jgi:dephospho-CoA kinase
VLVIGLTGGIGSGKTSVSDRFAKLGAPVIDTDVIAREMVAPGMPAYRDIRGVFGDVVLGRDGTLDRDTLRKLVFDDDRKRAELERILHPAIKQEVSRRLQGIVAPYCIVVVPLLIESGFTDIVDRILVVDAPKECRLRRVQTRSELTEAQVHRIFAAQANSEERRRRADDILDNEGELAELDDKVAALHRLYMRLSEQR